MPVYKSVDPLAGNMVGSVVLPNWSKRAPAATSPQIIVMHWDLHLSYIVVSEVLLEKLFPEKDHEILSHAEWKIDWGLKGHLKRSHPSVEQEPGWWEQIKRIRRVHHFKMEIRDIDLVFIDLK